MANKEKPAAAKSAKSVMGKYTIELFGGKDLRAAVKLPDGEDLNEWLAVHSTPVGKF